MSATNGPDRLRRRKRAVTGCAMIDGLCPDPVSRRCFCRLAAGGLVLCATGAGTAGGAALPVRTLRPGVLRIGTYFVNPQFEFVSGGVRIGSEVDLMTDIARRIGRRPVFEDTRWEVMLGEMRQNRYDCIMGGITITPERQKTLAWSTPYMTTTLSLVIDGAKSSRIASLADLKGATVGVQAATTDYDAALAMRARGEIGEIKVYSFARIGRAMTDLAAGRITAVMKVYPVAAWLARATPGLRILAQVPYDPQPLGIGFNEQNPGLRAAVDDALTALGQDGTYDRLTRKWGVQ